MLIKRLVLATEREVKCHILNYFVEEQCECYGHPWEHSHAHRRSVWTDKCMLETDGAGRPADASPGQ